MFRFVKRCNNFEILKKTTEVWDNRRNVHEDDENRINTIKSVAIVHTNILEVMLLLCVGVLLQKYLFHCCESLEKYLVFLNVRYIRHSVGASSFMDSQRNQLIRNQLFE